MGLVELKVKEYPEEQANHPVSTFTKIVDAASDAAKIAADAVKKFGVAPEMAGNGPILNANEKDDKLPVRPKKAPEIENFTKISDAAAELLDQNDF